MDKVKKAFKILKYILLVLVLFVLSIVVIQRVTNNKVKLFGYSIYTIVSESMKPVYEIGDVVLAKSIKQEELKLRDDLVYKGKEGDFKDKIVTHRLVQIKGGHSPKYVMKGVANQVEDPEITFDQIEGRVIRKSIIMSFISKITGDNALFFVIVFIPFTILIFADINDMVKEKKAIEKEKLLTEMKQEENKEE